MCQGVAMARAAGPTVVIRSRWSQALGVAMALTGVVGLVLALRVGDGSAKDYGAPLLLFALLGWAAFWRPQVEVSDGGVRITNTWRTAHVTWPAITAVEGRYGLRLRTAQGNVTSWAAPAPAGRARARGQESRAADIVNNRLEELRAAGYLDNPALERDTLDAAWNIPVAVTAGVLLVASVLLPLLG
jgi:hypothetical protein